MRLHKWLAETVATGSSANRSLEQNLIQLLKDLPMFHQRSSSLSDGRLVNLQIYNIVLSSPPISPRVRQVRIMTYQKSYQVHTIAERSNSWRQHSKKSTNSKLPGTALAFELKPCAVRSMYVHTYNVFIPWEAL